MYYQAKVTPRGKTLSGFTPCEHRQIGQVPGLFTESSTKFVYRLDPEIPLARSVELNSDSTQHVFMYGIPWPFPIPSLTNHHYTPKALGEGNSLPALQEEPFTKLDIWKIIFETAVFKKITHKYNYTTILLSFPVEILSLKSYQVKSGITDK